MKINSLSFEDDTFIPSKHTCDGENVSPELHWQDVPQETKSFVLIMDDPDAPNDHAWTHWLIYNIPSNCNSLVESIEGIKDLPDGAKFGTNSWGNQAYRGPCLPIGQYRYFFILYALSDILDVPTSITREELIPKIQEQILDKAELMGRYERKNK